MPQFRRMWALESIWTFTTRITCGPTVDGAKFEDGVKAVIATFAVFTGVALKDYATETHLGDLHWYAFALLVALLLRYIIGSSMHLTYTYAQKDAPDNEPNSESVALLIKDLVFLVIFGVFAVRMAKAADFASFLCFATWFLAWGFIWSVLDCIIRFAWCWRTGNDHEWPKRQFWLVWALLDAVQIAVTLAVPDIFPGDELTQARVLVIAYILFLYADLKAMARTMQVAPVVQQPDPPAAEQPAPPVIQQPGAVIKNE